MLYLCRTISLCAIWLTCHNEPLYALGSCGSMHASDKQVHIRLEEKINVYAAALFTDTIIHEKEPAIPNEAIERADAFDFKYAILLDKEVEEVLPMPLFRFIKEWIGVPYAFGGNDKDGIDCSGFVQRLVSTLYNVPLSRMVKTQFEECRPLLRDELRAGDLLFFHTTRPGLSHVGYYLGNNKFVHASTMRGVIIDDLCDPYYDKAFRHGGRMLPKSELPAISANE